MLKAYVAGPYRAATESGVHHNIERARAVAEKLWQKGYAVFCPHLNSAYMGGVVSDDAFLQGGMAWLRVSDFVVLVPAYHDSLGTLAEIALAEDLGIRIYGDVNDVPRLGGVGC